MSSEFKVKRQEAMTVLFRETYGGMAIPDSCPAREDGIHCEHWWDCGDCHSCGLKYVPDPLCDCDKCATARSSP